MINKHLASLAFQQDSPFTNSCLFTLDRLPLLLLLYAETSSSAVQKRHSKVYGNPIAPSFYSISPCMKQCKNFTMTKDKNLDEAKSMIL